MSDWMVILPVVVPLALAILGLPVLRDVGVQKFLLSLGTAGILAQSCLLLAGVLANGTASAALGSWPGPYGIVLSADTFSALMVVVSALTGFACAIYALDEVPEELWQKGFASLCLLLLTGVHGSFLTRDLFNLYVWFEVMLLSSFVLLVLGGNIRQLRGGLTYVILNVISSILFLTAAGLLYGKVGTLNMGDLAIRLSDHPDAVLVNSSSVLLLVSFSIKAGLFPFYFWLPASYHTPRFAVSALFAGLLTKVGVYALIRLFGQVLAPNFGTIELLVVFLAGATMLMGVLGAASQYHTRKILSFHIISQIGYMVMGLALLTPLALTAAIFYILHHIVVKANLFLIAGMIQVRTGGEHLKSIGGLYRSAPGLALLFAVPAASLAGIPPLSGFWAKLGIIRAGIEVEAFLLVAVALGVGLLTLFSMTKIWAEAFWKDVPENSPTETTRLSWARWLPTLLLAAITILIGLAGQPLWEWSERAAAEVLNPASLHTALDR